MSDKYRPPPTVAQWFDSHDIVELNRFMNVLCIRVSCER